MAGPEFCAECGSLLPRDGRKRRYCPGCLLKAGLGEDHSGPLDTAVLRGRRPAPPPEELQPHFPRLEIQGPLGKGGMGWVYRAHQKDLDRTVALKVLPVEFHGQEGARERFRREAKALAQLNHPHVVTVFDSGEVGDYVYFVMEYVDGTNLREIMRDEPLAPRDALGLMAQVFAALEYAHERGVVHRDVKPENVLVDRAGTVKVADFGLARLVGERPDQALLTDSNQVLGTPHYMAPEQWERPRDVDHRADVYGLGVMFYEMLTGELPLGRFEPPSQRAPIDPRLDAVVLKALEKEPSRRHQSVRELQTDLEKLTSAGLAVPAALATGQGSSCCGPARRSIASHGSDFLGWLWLAAILCLILPLAVGLSPVLLWVALSIGVVLPGALTFRHFGTSRGRAYATLLFAFSACALLGVAVVPDLAYQLDYCLSADPSVPFWSPDEDYLRTRRHDVETIRAVSVAMFFGTVAAAVVVSIVQARLARRRSA